MTPSVLAAPAPANVPSTKTWLVLLSLLSLLLVIGHWSQPVASPRTTLAGRPAAAQATARRVSLKSPARLAGASSAFATAATL